MPSRRLATPCRGGNLNLPLQVTSLLSLSLSSLPEPYQCATVVLQCSCSSLPLQCSQFPVTCFLPACQSPFPIPTCTPSTGLPYYNRIVGSVVECSPTTRAARVRFPDDTTMRFFIWTTFHFSTSQSPYHPRIPARFATSYRESTTWSKGCQTRDQPLSTPTQPTQIPTYHSMGELQKGPHSNQCPAFPLYPLCSLILASYVRDPPRPPMFVIPPYLLCSLPPRPLPTSRIHHSPS